MLVALGWNGVGLTDTWAFSLGEEPAWSEIVATPPGPLVSYSTGGYDYPFGRLLVAGGSDSLGECAVHLLPLAGHPAWRFLQGPPGPPARTLMAGTVITAQGRFLIHGGYEPNLEFRPGRWFDDLWLFDSLRGAWRELHPSGPRPDPRCAHTAINDPARGRVLVFGGESPVPCLYPICEPSVAFHHDAWSFSLADTIWTLLSDAGPRRAYHSAVYDAVRDRMLVFGGLDTLPGFNFSNEVWAFDLKSGTWSLLHPAGVPPPPRAQHTAVYDPLHDRMVVFGGVGPDAATTSQFGDTWVLDFGSSAAPTLATAVSGDFEPGGHVDFTGAMTSHVGARQIHVVRLYQDPLLGSTVDMPTRIEPGATDTVRWTSAIPDSVEGDLAFAATAFVNQIPVLGDTLHFAVHVPALVRSVHAVAEPERVSLSWQMGDAVVPAATLYRRPAGDPWSVQFRDFPIGHADALVTFVDHLVAPGLRYEYRLGITSAGHEVFRGFVAVEVPGARALALHRVWPNPSHGALTVAFTLPEASPAMLEVIDLAGRLVSSERVEALGAGTHRVTIQPPASRRSGLYFVRVRQAGHESSTRVTFVR
jgi:hypothetical protein